MINAKSSTLFAVLLHPSATRLATLAAALLVLVGTAAACGDDDGEPPEPTATPTPASIGDRLRGTEYPQDLIKGRRLGAADANLDVIVFEDFNCSHCLDFTANVEPMLIEDYVIPGHISLEVRHFPILGQASVAAAIAAQCALRQEAFWPYQKALFIEQAEDRPFSLESFLALGDGLGLDHTEMEACLNDLATVPEVEADYEEARTTGFTGTPSVLVNGEPVENPGTAAAWKSMLDAALNE